MRGSCRDFSLWLDLETRLVWEAELGEISLFRKRVLGKLLCFLITHAGRRYTAGELFEAVWLADYDTFIDFRTVKTNISRLRSLIEPAAPEWRYILKTDPTFLGRGGEYYFNSQCSYCLVQTKWLDLKN